MHSQEHRLEVRHKVWLDTGGRFALGDGGTELLRAIEATGSIRDAVRRVGWSYRHALAYLDNAEGALGYPLAQRVRGGHQRGGTRLSIAGRDFLHRYLRFRREAEVALLRLYRSAFGIVRVGHRPRLRRGPRPHGRKDP